MLHSQIFQMEVHVAKGAPYLALDLFEVEELSIRDNLPIPNRKRGKDLSDEARKLLKVAARNEDIFTETTISKSGLSSRSSVVEFPY